MLHLLLVMAGALGAGTAHQPVTVEHRGAAYQVSYQPQVIVSMKTVGIAAGTRMSSERCRWTAEVRVERHIRRSGGDAAHAKLLPATRTIRGSEPGSCVQARAAVDEARIAAMDVVRRHVAQVAAHDHPTLLADIDAAHALANAG